MHNKKSGQQHVAWDAAVEVAVQEAAWVQSYNYNIILE